MPATAGGATMSTPDTRAETPATLEELEEPEEPEEPEDLGEGDDGADNDLVVAGFWGAGVGAGVGAGGGAARETDAWPWG